MKKSFFGENNPSTLDTIVSLGVEYIKQDKHAKAEILLKSVLGELGENPATCKCMRLLCFLYEARGKHGQA